MVIINFSSYLIIHCINILFHIKVADLNEICAVCCVQDVQ